MRRNVNGARIGAYVIDVIILGAIALVILVALGGVEFATAESRFGAELYCERWQDDNWGHCSVTAATETTIPDGAITITPDGARLDGSTDWDVVTFRFLPIVLILLVDLVAYPLVQGLTGASPGKALVGLRVVTRDGGMLGMGRSFARTWMWIVDGLCNGLVGLITWIASKDKQRVGDMVAGTYVVHRSEVGLPIHGPVPGPGGPMAGPGSGGYDPYRASPASELPGWSPAPTPPSFPSAEPPTAGTLDDLGDLRDLGQRGDQGASDESSGAAGPVWDPARDTYVQYDPELGAWVQWNESTGAWERMA